MPPHASHVCTCACIVARLSAERARACARDCVHVSQASAPLRMAQPPLQPCAAESAAGPSAERASPRSPRGSPRTSPPADEGSAEPPAPLAPVARSEHRSHVQCFRCPGGVATRDAAVCVGGGQTPRGLPIDPCDGHAVERAGALIERRIVDRESIVLASHAMLSTLTHMCPWARAPRFVRQDPSQACRRTCCGRCWPRVHPPPPVGRATRASRRRGSEASSPACRRRRRMQPPGWGSRRPPPPRFQRARERPAVAEPFLVLVSPLVCAGLRLLWLCAGMAFGRPRGFAWHGRGARLQDRVVVTSTVWC